MNVLRTSLVLITASALGGIVIGAPHLNRGLRPEAPPVTVVPPVTSAPPAARAAAVEPSPDARLEMASLEMFGPQVELDEAQTRAMIQRWRMLQARAIAAPALPEPEPEIAERDLHRPEFGVAQRSARRLDDRYRERGFYGQSRWGQRGIVATDRTPTGGRSIFSQSRWAGQTSSNYRRVGNRLIRQTNKRITRYR